MPTRREFISAAGSMWAGRTLRLNPGRRSFCVFGLLEPAVLNVSPLGAVRLHCATASIERVIERPERISIVKSSAPAAISGPNGGDVAFVLEAPGLIRRWYYGCLLIRCQDDVLVPTVSMDCETATGSIVGAELPVWGAPLNALAAQAVVSRSILFASNAPRHPFADFCDTTHCQFLRSPADPGSAASVAVEQTARIVLMQEGCVMSPRYSAACGGITEAGIDRGHRYASVVCEICSRHSKLRRGHGWGLCQEGALGFARLGWSWRAILAKYYPSATLGQSPTWQ